MALPEIVTRKFGPLPGWAWGGLGIGAALVWSSFRRAKAEKDATDGQGDNPGVGTGMTLPDSLQPTYVFQNYDQDVTYNNTTPAPVPPGGGRPPGKVPPPVPTPTPVPRPNPVPLPPPPPTPTPKPTPAPAPKGQYVTVVPWKSGQPKGTPSTIWGIAEKVYGIGKVSNTLTNTIWNAPQNANLRASRKKPDLIRAGDKVWVPQ